MGVAFTPSGTFRFEHAMKTVTLAVLAAMASRAWAVTNSTANSTINSQLRLAYFGNNAMMVSWNTFSQVSNPTVHFGLSAANLNNTATSNVSITYPTSLTYNNHVLVTGLQPNTTYYYRPAPLTNENSTTPFHFTTSRVAGDMEPYSIAVVVDLGTMGERGLTTHAGKSVAPTNVLQPGEINTIQSLTQYMATFDLVWHPGDIAYADYWLKEEIQGFLPNTTIGEGFEVYESILNDYYDEMMGVTATKPYMVGPGNHEATCDNGGTTDKSKNITYDISICIPGQLNFTGYKNHFRMPSSVSGGTGNFWYSWDHGMVHYIQLDTETDLGHGFIGEDEVGGGEGLNASSVNATMDAQTKWLEADLKAVNRTKTPWVIAAGHRPWYLSHANESGTICWTCKDVFEPLLIKYNVDLMLSGHAHVYERQAPLANGAIDKNELNNPSAPWYITNGAAGHYDGLDELDSPRKPFSRFGLDTSNATYGWSRITFHNCTHLTHEFVASGNGSVLDTATLYKNRTCATSSAGVYPPQVSTNGAAEVLIPSWLILLALVASFLGVV
jgi:acid phosphatase type 7